MYITHVSIISIISFGLLATGNWLTARAYKIKVFQNISIYFLRATGGRQLATG
jgi:hypothetical protein